MSDFEPDGAPPAPEETVPGTSPSDAPEAPSTAIGAAASLARRISAVGHAFPIKRDVAALADELMGILYPQLSVRPSVRAPEVTSRLLRARDELGRIVRPLVGEAATERVMDGFMAALPSVHERSLEDAAAILAGDPAAESLDEVIAAYPGFLAMAMHRLAHVICALGVPIVPRLMAEVAHSQSGIDIHPGASIGRRFCIDHGTGVVIGETAVIGDDVKLYQGVTLGALSVAKALAGTKRHPTIGDRVVIYANATVLGGDTVIGADSVIGGNVFLTGSVPPSSLVYQPSGHRVRRQRDGFDGADFVI